MPTAAVLVLGGLRAGGLDVQLMEALTMANQDPAAPSPGSRILRIPAGSLPNVLGCGVHHFSCFPRCAERTARFWTAASHSRRTVPLANWCYPRKLGLGISAGATWAAPRDDGNEGWFGTIVVAKFKGAAHGALGRLSEEVALHC